MIETSGNAVVNCRARLRAELEHRKKLWADARQVFAAKECVAFEHSVRSLELFISSLIGSEPAQITTLKPGATRR